MSVFPLIADDFAPNALQIRREVVAGGFGTETGPDGLKYTGISERSYPELFALIAKTMGRPIIPRLACFRINYAGENPHSWIHSDDICAQFASVLYLNEPEQCQGGTAFWKHRGIGIDRMPNADALARAGYDAKWFCAMMQKEWCDLTWWEQRAMVEMKFNRFLTYPTSLFHSRHPFEGFGTVPEDGRLIWVCFYDLAPQPEGANV